MTKDDITNRQNIRRGNFGYFVGDLEVISAELPLLQLDNGKWWLYDVDYMLEIKQGKK